MSRWKYEVEAKDPSGTGTWKTGVPAKYIEKLIASGDTMTVARLGLAKTVLEEGNRIVKGWNRDQTEECLIYIGSPGNDFKSGLYECPPPPGMVFVVFVLHDGTIDHWTWRESGNDSELPQGIKGEQIWPPLN